MLYVADLDDVAMPRFDDRFPGLGMMLELL